MRAPFGGRAEELRLIENRRSRILRNPYAPRLKSKSKSYAVQATKPTGKEAIMLDFAFVALGFAMIALTGFYATALRQL